MVNNVTNINKVNNNLSPQIIKHIKKKTTTFEVWKSRSWLWTGTQMWQG